MVNIFTARKQMSLPDAYQSQTVGFGFFLANPPVTASTYKEKIPDPPSGDRGFLFKAWQWSGPPPEAAGVRPIKPKLLAFILRAYPTFP